MFTQKGPFLLKFLKILLDADLKIILLEPQNNYVGRSSIMSDAAQSFNILCSCFDGITKLFSGLCAAKFLHALAKKKKIVLSV